jgi:acyl dehydratase
MYSPWYSPWLDTLRQWQQMAHRYWSLSVPPRLGVAAAVEARAGRAAASVAEAADPPATVFGLRVGDRRAFTHTVTEARLESFAAASGDRNPLHMDAKYAAQTRFGHRIAHGMLSASFISAALATLGGEAATTIYLSQSLRFLRPVAVGDTIRTELKVLQVDPAKNRLVVETVCRNQHDEVVVAGEATILLDPYPFAA